MPVHTPRQSRSLTTRPTSPWSAWSPLHFSGKDAVPGCELSDASRSQAANWSVDTRSSPAAWRGSKPPPPIVMLGSLLSADEDKHRADGDRRYSGNGRNQPFLLRCDLDWPDLDFIAALRVAHAAHREDDSAGDDEKHTDPSEWPHCYPVGEKDISCGALALVARRPRISTRIR